MICLLFVLEKTLGSPLEFKEIKPVNPKGNQPWIFIRRTVAEALILWPPGAKSGLTEKDPDAGKDWRQKEKRAAEDERVRQHHWLNGREFEQTPGEMEDRGALCTAVHGITKSQTRLSNQTPPPVCQHHGNLFFSALQSAISWAPRKVSRVWQAMAPHSRTLAWKVPWMEAPGSLQSMGLLRVGHDWATSLSLFTFMNCRRKWQPTPVFLPGESQGQGNLVGCHLWGCTESDTTEVT